METVKFVKDDNSPTTDRVASQPLNDLLVVQLRELWKELDGKHHLAETEYLRTKSKFDKGRTAALAEVCSKLMVILNKHY